MCIARGKCIGCALNRGLRMVLHYRRVISLVQDKQYYIENYWWLKKIIRAVRARYVSFPFRSLETFIAMSFELQSQSCAWNYLISWLDGGWLVVVCFFSFSQADHNWTCPIDFSWFSSSCGEKTRAAAADTCVQRHIGLYCTCVQLFARI